MDIAPLVSLQCTQGKAFAAAGFHRVIDFKGNWVDLNAGRDDSDDIHQAVCLWTKQIQKPQLDASPESPCIVELKVASEKEFSRSMTMHGMTRLTEDIRCLKDPTYIFGRIDQRDRCDPICDVRVLPESDRLAPAELFQRASGKIGRSSNNQDLFLWYRRCSDKSRILDEEAKIRAAKLGASLSFSSSSSKSDNERMALSGQNEYIQGMEWHMTYDYIQMISNEVLLNRASATLWEPAMDDLVRSCIGKKIVPANMLPQVIDRILLPLTEIMVRLLLSDSYLGSGFFESLLRILGGDPDCRYLYNSTDVAAYDRTQTSLANRHQYRYNRNTDDYGAITSPNFTSGPAYLGLILDHFRATSGFDSLIHRISGATGKSGDVSSDDEESLYFGASARISSIDETNRVRVSQSSPGQFLFSFGEIYRLVNTIDEVADMISNKSMQAWAKTFERSILNRLKLLGNSRDRGILKDVPSATDAISLLENDMSPAMNRLVSKLCGPGKVVAGRFLERGKLCIALSMLHCTDSLKIQIRGAELLNEIVDSVKAWDASTGNERGLIKIRTGWLTKEKLVGWAIENDVITKILSDSWTQRNSNRSRLDDGPNKTIFILTENLVSLVAKGIGASRQEHIVELLWCALRSDTAEKSSQIRKSLGRILQSIGSSLKDEALDFLRIMISTMPLDAYDTLLVNIIRECAIAEIREGNFDYCNWTRNVPDFPKLLWKLIVSDNAKQNKHSLGIRTVDNKVKPLLHTNHLEAQVVALASEALVDILISSGEAAVILFARRCIEVVKDNHRIVLLQKDDTHNQCTPQCLQLCMQLLNVLNGDSFSYAANSRAKVVESWISDYDLIQFLVDESVIHVRTAVELERKSAVSRTLESADTDNGAAASRLKKSTLSIRLAFLKFIAQSAPIDEKLTAEQISLLWHACLGGRHNNRRIEDNNEFCSDPLNTTGGDIGCQFLKWLRELLPSQNFSSNRRRRAAPQSLVAGAAQEIFVSLFCADNDTTNISSTSSVHNAIVRSASKVSEDIALPLDTIARQIRGHQSGHGYDCFEFLMRHVNSELNILKKSMSRANFEVVCVEGINGVKGLNALWTTALDANAGESVCKKAQFFLAKLYTNLRNDIYLGKVWAGFASKCIIKLRKALHRTSGQDSVSNSLLHPGSIVLNLLTTFLEEVERPENHQRVRDSRGVEFSQAPKGFIKFVANVKTEEDFYRSHRYAVFVPSRGATLGQLRKAIARACNHSANCLRMTYHNKSTFLHASLDNISLHDLRIYNSRGIQGIKLDQPADDTKDYEDSSSIISYFIDEASLDKFQKEPRRLLSTESRNFDVFFGLLSSPSEKVVQNAWQLLCRLPLNDEIMNRIQTLGGKLEVSKDSQSESIIYLELAQGFSSTEDVPWNDIFGEINDKHLSKPSRGSARILKLLYSLRIIESLSYSGEDYDEINSTYSTILSRKKMKINQSEVDVAKKWTRFFFVFGGLRYLYNDIFLNGLDLVNMINEGLLTQECLILLLVLLKRFLFFCSDRESNASDHNSYADGRDELISPALDKSQLLDSGLKLPHMIDRLLHVVSAVAKFVGMTGPLNIAGKQVLRSLSSNDHKEEIVSSVETKEKEEKESFIQDEKIQANNEGRLAMEPPQSEVTKSKMNKKYIRHVQSRDRDDSRDKSYEAIILSHAFDLINACIASTEKVHSVVPLIYDFHDLGLFLEQGVLQGRRSNIRSEVSKQVQRMCHHINHIIRNRIAEIRPERKMKLKFGLFSVVSKNQKGQRADDKFCSDNQSTLNPYNKFLNLASQSLASVELFEEQSDEYFQLLINLIERTETSEKGNIGTEIFEQLWRSITRMIIDRPVTEIASHDNDRLLFRLFQVGIAMARRASGISKNSNECIRVPSGKVDVQSLKDVSLWPSSKLCDQLLTELCQNCLFKVPVDTLHRTQGLPPPPKCKNPRTTRKAAFRLVRYLCQNRPEQTTTLCNLLRSHHCIRNLDGILNRSLGTPETRSATGYVGLNNLGATCYINSSLQQFYMIPSFRKELIDFKISSADLLSPEKYEGLWNSHEGESKFSAQNIVPGEHNKQAVSIVKELANLFIQLQESERKFVDTSAFVSSYRDPYGEVIDYAVQADASEFLTAFFQHVDNATSGTEKAGMLRGMFQGSISNELLQKDRCHDGTRCFREADPSDFFFLSVKVKGLKCLQDSLHDYFSAETVDLRWDSEKSSEDSSIDITSENKPTLKRCSLTSLSKHLLIHLQRFQFDYDKMAQVKVNDAFEFPLELDMSVYSKEGRPDRWPPENVRSQAVVNESKHSVGDPQIDENYYHYILRGIVIHDGTAQAGHYYSYACEREHSASTGKKSRWFEMNDTEVKHFDITKLAEAAFGGTKSVTFQENDYYGTATTTVREREQTSNAFILIYDRKTIGTNKIINEPERSDHMNRSHGNITVLENDLSQIWNDNFRYCRMKHIFDPVYFTFMEQIANLQKVDEVVFAHLSGLVKSSAIDKIVQKTAEFNYRVGEGEINACRPVRYADMLYEKGERVRAFVMKIGKWYSGVVTRVDHSSGGSYLIEFDNDTTSTVAQKLVTRDIVPPLHPTKGALYTEGERVMYKSSIHAVYTKYAQILEVSAASRFKHGFVQYSIRFEEDGSVCRGIDETELKPVHEQSMFEIEKAASKIKSNHKSENHYSNRGKNSNKTNFGAIEEKGVANDPLVKSVLANCTSSATPDLTKLAARFVLGTLCYASSSNVRASLAKWVSWLSLVVRNQSSGKLSRWLIDQLLQPWADLPDFNLNHSDLSKLENHGQTPFNYLLYLVPNRYIRAEIGRLLCAIVTDLLSRCDSASKTKNNKNNKKKRLGAGIFSPSTRTNLSENDDCTEDWSKCISLINSCLNMLEGTSALDTRTAHIGAVLRAFADSCPRAREYLIRQGALKTLSAFFLGSCDIGSTGLGLRSGVRIPFARQLSTSWEADDPPAAPVNEGWTSGDRIKPGTGMPQLTPMLETLSLLILSCAPPQPALLPALRVLNSDDPVHVQPPNYAFSEKLSHESNFNRNSFRSLSREAVPVALSTKWACPHCTLHNEMNSLCCKVCGTTVSKREMSSYVVEPEPVLTTLKPSKPTLSSQNDHHAMHDAFTEVDSKEDALFWDAQDDVLWDAIGHMWMPLSEDDVTAAAKLSGKIKLHLQLDPCIEDKDVLSPIISRRSILALITGQLCTKKRLHTIGPLVSHLCWENARVSEMFVKIIASGIILGDYDTIHPYFGTAKILVSMQDSLAHRRCRSLMTAVLGSMFTQRNYLRATESGIELILEIARTSSAARTWLLTDEGKHCLNWVPTWLKKNIDRARRKRRGSYMRLHKRQDTDVSTMDVYSGKFYLVEKLNRLMAGEEISPPPTNALFQEECKRKRYIL